MLLGIGAKITGYAQDHRANGPADVAKSGAKGAMIGAGLTLLGGVAKNAINNSTCVYTQGSGASAMDVTVRRPVIETIKKTGRQIAEAILPAKSKEACSFSNGLKKAGEVAANLAKNKNVQKVGIGALAGAGVALLAKGAETLIAKHADKKAEN